MAAPPSPAAPPPGLPGPLWRRLILVLWALCVCGLTVAWWVGIPSLLFLAQMGFLTLAICAVPAIASEVAGEERRFTRMALQIISFVTLLVVFALWVFGISALGIWIAYAVALILLLEVGGHLIQWYLELRCPNEECRLLGL
jgi:hypothetical protein